MSSIDWTDSTGAATLTNGKPEPADRLADWTPRDGSIGPAEWALKFGRINGAKFRRDGLVAFEIRGIPGSELPLMLRLKLHLMKGGAIVLDSDNVLGSRWVDATLAPGTVPSVAFSDNTFLEYTFGLVLLEPAAVV